MENLIYFHFVKVNCMTRALNASSQVVYEEANEIKKTQTV